MRNLLKAELFRAKFIKSIYIGLGITLFLTIINTVLIKSLLTQIGMSYIYSGKDLILNSVSENSAVFLIGIIVAIIVSGAFKNGGIKNALIGNATRNCVFFTYFIETASICLIYVLANYLLSGIFSTIIGYGYTFTATEFGILIGRLCLQYLCTLAYASIFLMIAFLARNTGGAIGASIGFYIIEDIIVSALFMLYLTGGKTWAYDLSSIFLGSCFTSTGTNLAMTTREICLSVFIPIIYILISSIVTIINFQKKDVK